MKKALLVLMSVCVLTVTISISHADEHETNHTANSRTAETQPKASEAIKAMKNRHNNQQKSMEDAVGE